VAQGLVFGFALVRYRYHKMYRIYTDVSVTAKSGSTTFRWRVNEKCVGRRRLKKKVMGMGLWRGVRG